METLRIVQVGSGMLPIPPPGYGAVEKHIWNLTKALKAKGHEVEILNEALGERPWNEYRFALRARRRLKGLPRDVIHIHTTGVAYTVKALGPRPFVYTSHSRHWVLRRGLRERLGFALERRAVGGAAAVIALSIRSAKLMQPAVQARLVPNGVDTDRYRPEPQARQGNRLLAVGRVEPHKGFHLAARALEGLPGHLTIVGPAPPGPYVERLRRHPQVTLTGVVSEEDLVGHMAASDIFIHPSSSEASSLAVLEALASGLPLVATEVCEEQMEEGRNGFVVRGRNDYEIVAALRGALDRLLMDEALRKSMGTRSRSLAEQRYSWAKVGEGVEAVYRDVLPRG